MNSTFSVDHNGVRQLHWFRILLLSAAAPASIVLFCLAARLVAWRQMSSTWPWSDGMFWVVASVSWAAFGAGLIRAARTAPLEMETHGSA